MKGTVNIMDMKTPLYECHVQSEGKMVSFAGYILPVQYKTGVIAEHLAVRKAAGLFDISHMGEVILEGRNALDNIQKLVTNDCSALTDGRVRYSPMCNEEGGVVDDLLIYRINQEKYMLVINAANRHKDIDWIKGHLSGDVKLADISDETAMIALQGPLSRTILTRLADEENLPAKYYTFRENVNVSGINCLVSKTGYTGEEGYELCVRNEDAPKLWEMLLNTGKNDGLIPCGLGARDTLRLEAAMPLYGHEMDDSISPLEAGLDFAVKMDKDDFIGKRGIIAKGEPKVTRVGLKITGRGIARENCPVFYEDKLIGRTTSGTHSPYFGYPIAMALIDKEYAQNGTELLVEVRGKKIAAQIVPLPFYKRQ